MRRVHLPQLHPCPQPPLVVVMRFLSVHFDQPISDYINWITIHVDHKDISNKPFLESLDGCIVLVVRHG